MQCRWKAGLEVSWTGFGPWMNLHSKLFIEHLLLAKNRTKHHTDATANKIEKKPSLRGVYILLKVDR